MNARWAAIPIALFAPMASAQWTHYGRDASRVAVSNAPAPDLSAPAWVVGQTSSGASITFDAPTGVVASSGRAFALGLVDGSPALIAFDLNGTALWHKPVEPTSLDTWASPVLAPGAVIAPSGDDLVARDPATGAELWRTELELPVVNASPVVTDDLGPADRLFVTDYDGTFATFEGGSLYCVNIDPYHAQLNPHEPGDVVWRVPLIAATSGNSPAYDNGVVYVADAGDPFFGDPGAVQAFDATATGAPQALWRTEASGARGYYGGVSVAGGYVYAATYAFYGGLSAGTLTKLDAATGAEVWEVPANRTSSTPVPMPNGRVLLSAGVDGFGSAPSLSLFESDGTRLWDTAIDTWNDDGDGAIEPGEYFPLGGWTHLPVALGGSRALAGTLPIGSLFGAYNELSVIDLDKAPTDPGFVVESTTGAGSTPALADGLVLTAGPGGLYAFRAGPDLDVDGSGAVDAEDLYTWHAAPVDLDGDGASDLDDAQLLEAALRSGGGT